MARKHSAHDPALARFSAEVDCPEAEIDLARAALTYGLYEYPTLSVAGFLERIDRLADSASRALSGESRPAAALAHLLFDQLGFSGNTQNYHDPRNSFLNDVIERRLGIPITLSVLYLEVARHLRIEAAGIGLPGHFVVRATDAGGEIYLDPFHQGIEISEAECRKRVSDALGDTPSDESIENFFQPAGKRVILARMLNNLRAAYMASGDTRRAIRIVERLRVLDPGNADELRNLGILMIEAGDALRGLALLERYLEGQPPPSDADHVRAFVRTHSQAIARWN